MRGSVSPPEAATLANAWRRSWSRTTGQANRSAPDARRRGRTYAPHARMPHDQRDPAADGTPSAGARPTDQEIRAIAERLVAEAGAAPPASPPAEMSAQTHELAPAEEDRVERAVVELGAADWEDTTPAERGRDDPNARPDGPTRGTP
jgi:hypothetical protein